LTAGEVTSKTPALPPASNFLGTGLFVAAFVVLAATKSFDAWGAFLLAPVLVLIAVPILARQASREGDPAVLWLLLAALGAKLIGAFIRHYFAFEVYGGVADAGVYHNKGVALAEKIRAGNQPIGDLLSATTGTEFIRHFTGVLYAFIGSSLLGGFIFYSWMGFWGLFFFYRAFRIAVPEGRKRFYAYLLFFLPSLLFWPSSIGKESWMVLTLGIAALGAARVFEGSMGRGLLLTGVGLWLAAIVRPHVAVLMGMGLTFGYLVHRPSERLKELAPVVKVVAVCLLAAAAFVLLGKTDAFVEGTHVDVDGGRGETLDKTAERTAQGGSAFSATAVRSPHHLPIAALTVLFRPFPMEANNGQAVVAAVEGVFLLGFSLVRFRWIWSALMNIRRQSYAALAFCYVGLFVIVFSSIANFGILTRQRVQVLPLYLVLLAIPPVEKKNESSRRRFKEAALRS
jgi:hypothetical protein